MATELTTGEPAKSATATCIKGAAESLQKACKNER